MEVITNEVVTASLKDRAGWAGLAIDGQLCMRSYGAPCVE